MSKSEEAALGQKRVAVYTRVSTDDQDLVRQQKEIMEFLQKETIVGPEGTRIPKYVIWNDVGYSDYAKSGRTFAREGLQQMMKDAKMKKFEEVLVWGLSRLGRNLKESVNFLADLEKAGVDTYDIQMKLRYSDEMQRMTIHNLCSFFDYQYTMMVKNTQEKMDQIGDDLKAAGCRLGNAGILDDWVESPRVVREDKQGLAVKYSEAKEQAFRDLWEEGLAIKTMCFHFRSPVNFKCKYCDGKPPKDTEIEMIHNMRCRCNQPCTEKTIHTTRKKLGLEKRNHHSFITKKRAAILSKYEVNFNEPVSTE
jgi:DNA invertase Pin-like site-specific DNA recombinase